MSIQHYQGDQWAVLALAGAGEATERTPMPPGTALALVGVVLLAALGLLVVFLVALVNGILHRADGAPWPVAVRGAGRAALAALMALATVIGA